MITKMHIKKNDMVQILSGKNKGKKGKVLEVSPKEGKIIVEGCNIVTKHVKPRKMGEPGGLIKAEAPIYACKAMVICPKCGKPTRTGIKVLENGDKQRVCKRQGCQESF